MFEVNLPERKLSPGPQLLSWIKVEGRKNDAGKITLVAMYFLTV